AGDGLGEPRLSKRLGRAARVPPVRAGRDSRTRRRPPRAGRHLCRRRRAHRRGRSQGLRPVDAVLSHRRGARDSARHLGRPANRLIGGAHSRRGHSRPAVTPGGGIGARMGPWEPASRDHGRRSMQGQIVVSGLTKVYPKVRAVDDLSFTVEPGRVTGFLGPNGSGKTTTLRMMLNLVRPTAGTATIDGKQYADLEDPLGVVGAVLEASRSEEHTSEL